MQLFAIATIALQVLLISLKIRNEIRMQLFAIAMITLQVLLISLKIRNAIDCQEPEHWWQIRLLFTDVLVLTAETAAISVLTVMVLQ